MLNLCTKHIILSCDLIWLKTIYGEYVSRKENNKADSYNLQNEENSYQLAHLKINHVKNEVKTENVKN